MRKNIFLLIVSLFISFSVAEIYFNYNGKHKSNLEVHKISGYVSPFNESNNGWYRRYSPHQLIKEEKPEFLVSFKTNNEGFRDKDFSLKKKCNSNNYLRR